ncbi:hypothetical protein CISIN_1g045785mg [Citrus sinensis]|uniref:Uncharacterized protein n=1 Tax=Citrus sinensis TaxID=2711 RepID=A0A067E5B2_CITSI|nr:hypothetical protein CISIN_1g045785mg [Citrus sinensis]
MDFPSDRTGNLHSTYQFLDRNWRFVRWIALATLTLEVIALLLALYLRYVSQQASCHSHRRDEETIIHCNVVRQQTGKKIRKSNPATKNH